MKKISRRILSGFETSRPVVRQWGEPSSGVSRLAQALAALPILAFLLASPAPGAFEEEFAGALALFQKKEYAQALSAFQKLKEENPAHPSRADTLLLQGFSLRALSLWPEAAGVFSRAAAEHPLLADHALYREGEAWKNAGEPGRSAAAWKALVSRTEPSIWAARAWLSLAELHLQAREFRPAMEICENLLLSSPAKDIPGKALFLLGQAREGLSQWPEAARAYQDLWLKYPLHPLAGKGKARGEVLVREKKFSPETPPQALLGRALLLLQANRNEAARRELEAIPACPLQQYPAGYAGEAWVDELYFHRALSLFRLKQYGKAAEVFRLVTRASRNKAMAERSLYWEARSLFRLGRWNEAWTALSEWPRTHPQGAHLDRALFLKAAILEERSEIRPASALYRELAEGFPKSALRLPALWQSGWLLFRAGDWAGALAVWDRLEGLNPPPPWREKILYWKARALGLMGRGAEGEEIFRQILRQSPASYYALLAGRRLSLAPKGILPLTDRVLPPRSAGPGGSAPSHLEKGRLLLRLGLIPSALEELEAAEKGGRGEILVEISRLYRQAGEFGRSIGLVRRNFSPRIQPPLPREEEMIFYLLAYPLGESAWLNRFAGPPDLDPALLCAIVLEESRFDPQAVSVAGARGLMQVLPVTGQQLARRLDLPSYSDARLHEPEVNLHLGSYYFRRLLEEFAGQEVLALAAYNAGPHMVRAWLEKAPESPLDEFLESIPYAETRNYVIRVLGSAQMYRALYGASKP